MELLDLEKLAKDVRRAARLRPFDNERATVIVVRILGPDGIYLDDELRGAAYLRRRTDEGSQIVIRPDVPDIRFVLTHELSHHWIRRVARLKLSSKDEEHAANYMAAAILAPPIAVRAAYSFYGEDLRKLRSMASLFGLSQTAMQLRLAEVLGDERAIVTARNGNVIARGSRWTQMDLLSVVRRRGGSPGMTKHTLRGGIDEGRIALRAS